MAIQALLLLLLLLNQSKRHVYIERFISTLFILDLPKSNAEITREIPVPFDSIPDIIKAYVLFTSHVVYIDQMIGDINSLNPSGAYMRQKTTIGSCNGLSLGRRQAIIWIDAGMLLIRHIDSKFSEILIEINTFSFMKIHLKMSSRKWRPFYLGHNVFK